QEACGRKRTHGSRSHVAVEVAAYVEGREVVRGGEARGVADLAHRNAGGRVRRHVAREGLGGGLGQAQRAARVERCGVEHVTQEVNAGKVLDGGEVAAGHALDRDAAE